MAIFQATVPKELYEDMCRRYDELLEKYHQLRQSGAALPQLIKQHAAKSVEATAKGYIETAAANPELAEAAAKLQRDHKLPPELALKEAIRARDMLSGRATAPYTGHDSSTISI